MNNSSYFIFGLSIILLVAVLLICGLVFRMLKERNCDCNHDRRVVLDDRGDELLWQYGNARPIVDTLLPQSGLSRRKTLRTLALGTLASFAGWMAARGKHLLWAQETLTRSLGTKGGDYPIPQTHTD